MDWRFYRCTTAGSFGKVSVSKSLKNSTDSKFREFLAHHLFNLTQILADNSLEGAFTSQRLLIGILLNVIQPAVEAKVGIQKQPKTIEVIDFLRLSSFSSFRCQTKHSDGVDPPARKTKELLISCLRPSWMSSILCFGQKLKLINTENQY